jgi:hypothetical protein
MEEESENTYFHNKELWQENPILARMQVQDSSSRYNSARRCA